MAKLPQTVDMQGPNGATASGRAVDFSSIGGALQSVSQDVERYDQSRKAADQEVAKRELQPILDRYNAEATERWSLYDGRTFGQDAAEAQHFDGAFQPLIDREDLPPGVRDAMRQQVTAVRSEVMTQATATAARVRGARFAADRDTNEASAARSVYQNVLMAWTDREDEILGSITDPAQIPTALAEGYRTLIDEQLAAHPPGVADRARASLEAQGVEIVMGAVHGREIAEDRQTRANVQDAADVFINRIGRTPALFDTIDTELQTIAQGLPAAERAEFIREQKEKGGASVLDGMIRAGQAAEAQAAIDAGQFDYLPATVLDGARGNITAAQNVMTEEKAFAQAELTSRFQSNLATITQGGVADTALIAEARLLMKPEEVVEMALAQREAVLNQPIVSGLRTMTSEQAEAAIQARERLAATEGARQAVAELRRVKDADFSLRASNPQLWARSPIGPADTRRTQVANLWNAFVANPTPEGAATYSRLSLDVQREGGIGERERRLIDPATAREMVAGLERPGVDSVASFQQLRAFTQAFGRNEARTMVELSQAGMTPRATGALMHFADNPVAMTRYANGLAAQVDSEARQSIDAAMTAEIAPYRRTVASGIGFTATLEAATTVANGLVARGENPRTAAQIALQPIMGGMTYTTTFAIPRTAGVTSTHAWASAVHRLGTLTRGDMSERFDIPPIAGYSQADRVRRFRDRVSEGTWVSAPDPDDGLVLMVDLGAGPRPLLSKAGPVTMTWAEIRADRNAVSRARDLYVGP